MIKRIAVAAFVSVVTALGVVAPAASAHSANAATYYHVDIDWE
ncbi:hypothetical protein [Aeromicrobium sp.]